MPRPENRLDPGAGPVAAFACELRALRAAADPVPTYRRMARSVHFSVTALSQAAAGHKLPTWEVVRAFVTACGADPGEWEARYRRAAELSEGRPEGEAPDGPAQPPDAPTDAPTLPEPREPDGPDAADPAAAQTTALLMAALDAFRRAAGVSLRDLAVRSQNGPYQPKLSRTTLSNLLRGTGRKPTLDDVRQIVELCGGSPGDLARWTASWERLHGPLPPPDPAPTMAAQLRAATLTERNLVAEREPDLVHQRTPPRKDAPSSFVPRTLPTGIRALAALQALVLAAGAAAVLLLSASPDTGPAVTVGGAAVASGGTGVRVRASYRCRPGGRVVRLNVTVASISGARGHAVPVCDGHDHPVEVVANGATGLDAFQRGDPALVTASLLDVRFTVVGGATSESRGPLT